MGCWYTREKGTTHLLSPLKQGELVSENGAVPCSFLCLESNVFLESLFAMDRHAYTIILQDRKYVYFYR